MTSKGSKLTREEFKQKQDLEAARKAGTIPAELDFETGREINPHIPQYISQAPWYLDKGVPTLAHQRPQKSDFDNKEAWYQRGARVGVAVTKFRKGACENCGAMTHKTKDCVERPRKLGAKHTGKDLQPDEVIQSLELSFDGKRDRYNGYDAEEYLANIQEWEKIEEKRKEIRSNQLEENLRENPESTEGQPGDEDKYADEADMAGQKVDLKTRTTIRNLRIREDTAKYLRNLDINSAYYDPKTRSMRDNPNSTQDPKDLDYAGDNFVRYTGESKQMNAIQQFCWEANDKGVEISLQANPTQAELMKKGFQTKKDEYRESTKRSILDKYGGEEHLQVPPKELLFAQTEKYVEYSRTGQVIKGQELRLAKSRYEEDVYPNNHSSVWGSYWEDGRWGYACCHLFIKNSYCTGRAGIEAKKVSEGGPNQGTQTSEATQPKESSVEREEREEQEAKFAQEAAAREEERKRAREEFEAEEREKDAKFKELVEKERKEKKKEREREKKRSKKKKSKGKKSKKESSSSDSESDKSEDEKGEKEEEEQPRKKTKYNSMDSHEFKEEDYQKYLKSKQHFDDPMKNYVDDGATD